MDVDPTVPWALDCAEKESGVAKGMEVDNGIGESVGTSSDAIRGCLHSTCSVRQS